MQSCKIKDLTGGFITAFSLNEMNSDVALTDRLRLDETAIYAVRVLADQWLPIEVGSFHPGYDKRPFQDGDWIIGRFGHRFAYFKGMWHKLQCGGEKDFIQEGAWTIVYGTQYVFTDGWFVKAAPKAAGDTSLIPLGDVGSEVLTLIHRTFLANGFTVKEGQTDLKPYVYQAGIKLLHAADALVMDRFRRQWVLRKRFSKVFTE